tara:strand:+ start:136 stop:321 length:186 start_codon:yes stop_codon:yes gene_type:complete
MKSNQNSNGNSQNLFNTNKKGISVKDNENINYLSQNGNRITHQMRWFKGSRDRSLKSDLAA